MNDYLLNLQIYSFSANPPNNKVIAAKKGEFKDNYGVMAGLATTNAQEGWLWMLTVPFAAFVQRESS